MKHARITTRSAYAWTTAALLSAGLASTLASGALAQGQPQNGPRDIQGDFNRPLGEPNAPADFPAGTFRSVMTLSQQENGSTYALTIENGVKSATINGQPVPKERIRDRGENVDLLDPAGNVITTFKLPDVNLEPNLFNNRQNRQQQANRPDAWEMHRFGLAPLPGIDQPAPPVMLGITMSAQDGGVVVDRVVPGLPAERAGLKEGDIILRLDDQPVTTPEGLRAALREKKAGDHATIRVKRDGKELDLKAQLDAFNAAELGVNDQAAMVVRPFMDQAERSMEDAKRAVEEALEKVKAIDTAQIREDVESALNKALQSMEAAQAGAREQGQRWVDMLNRAPGTRMFLGDGEEQKMFVMPDGADPEQLRAMIDEQLRRFGIAPAQPMQPVAPQNPQAQMFQEDASRAMDRMSQQLERVMNRLDQLEQRLEQAEKKN